MIFIDTSFIIAWLNSNDLLHDHALNLLDAYKCFDALTSDIHFVQAGFKALLRNID